MRVVTCRKKAIASSPKPPPKPRASDAAVSVRVMFWTCQIVSPSSVAWCWVTEREPERPMDDRHVPGGGGPTKDLPTGRFGLAQPGQPPCARTGEGRASTASSPAVAAQ